MSSKVFYSETEHCIKDVVGRAGAGLYTGASLEKLRERVPDLQLLSLEEATKRLHAFHRKAPVRITKERFWEMLGMMPPMEWRAGPLCESFKLSERKYGDITMIFCRVGDDYWELHDDYTLSQKAIVRLIREALTPPPPQEGPKP